MPYSCAILEKAGGEESGENPERARRREFLCCKRAARHARSAKSSHWPETAEKAYCSGMSRNT